MDVNQNSTTYNSTVSNLKNLFKLHRFNFPRYQRDYSWNTSNIDDLIEDISNASKNSELMLGQIVLAKDKNDTRRYYEEKKFSNQNSNVVEVVDGQQRLTSLTMIILSLIEKDRGIHWYENTDEKAKNFRNWFLLEDDNNGAMQNRLRLATSQNQKIWDIILEPKPLNKKTDDYNQIAKKELKDGDTTLWETYCYVQKIIENFEEAKLNKLIRIVLNHDKADEYDTCINCNILIAEDAENGHLLFERINTKGTQLNSGDLIKSHLYVVLKDRRENDESIDLVMKEWESFETNFIEGEQLSDYLYHWLLANFGDKSPLYSVNDDDTDDVMNMLSNKNQVFKCFKSLITNKCNEGDPQKIILNIIIQLRYCSEIYNAICNPNAIESSSNDVQVPDMRFGNTKYANSIKSDLTHLSKLNVKQPRFFLLGVFFALSDTAKKRDKLKSPKEVTFSTYEKDLYVVSKMTLILFLKFSIARESTNTIREEFLKILTTVWRKVDENARHGNDVVVQIKNELSSLIKNKITDEEFKLSFITRNDIQNYLGLVILGELENAMRLDKNVDPIQWYERVRTNGREQQKYQLEHIYPQKKDSSYSEDLKTHGIEDKEIDDSDENIKNIGNMTILEKEKNRIASNKPFNDKKNDEAYGHQDDGFCERYIHMLLFRDKNFSEKQTHTYADFKLLATHYHNKFEKFLNIDNILNLLKYNQ